MQFNSPYYYVTYSVLAHTTGTKAMLQYNLAVSAAYKLPH